MLGTRARQLEEARVVARRLTKGLWRWHASVVLSALQLIPNRFPRQLAWIRIALPSGASRRFWLQDFTQARALVEVLCAHDYDIPVGGPVRTIIDLGANAGQASVYLHDRFPEATILAVEADPDIAGLAARNTSADARTRVISAAVTDRDGTVTLTRLPLHSWGSNVFSAWSSSESTSLEVRSIRLETLLREHALDWVDLLKVDIEGAEILALTSDEALSRVGTVFGELHPSILKMTSQEAVDVLQRQGRFEHGQLHSEFIFALTRTAVARTSRA